MRTPWRFLADLVSRKPEADVAVEPKDAAPVETLAIEHHPAPETVVDATVQALPDASNASLDETLASDGQLPLPNNTDEPNTGGQGGDEPETLSVPDAPPETLSETPRPDTVVRDLDDVAIATPVEVPISAAVAGLTDDAGTAPEIKADAQAQQSVTHDNAEAKPPARRARKKSQVETPALQPDPSLRSEGTPQSEPATRSPLDDLLDLDRDIAALRLELARKLSIQNEQLKNLIDRYQP
jgi:hypothetical protein